MPRAAMKDEEAPPAAELGWLEAIHDTSETAFEYWRDAMDARTPADLQDVQAFYANRQFRNGLNCTRALQALLAKPWFDWIESGGRVGPKAGGNVDA